MRRSDYAEAKDAMNRERAARRLPAGLKSIAMLSAQNGMPMQSRQLCHYRDQAKISGLERDL